MKLIESVPNFSCTGEALDAILEAIAQHDQVTVLDYSDDLDHNRSVVSLIGPEKPLADALFAAIKRASEVIDLRDHKGAHPRMGATDVVPFIPIANATMEDCVELSKHVAKRVGEELQIPAFLYEKSAASKERENLATIRKGQFEGMKDKMKDGFKPDFGPDVPHESAGVTAFGARKPLIAYNINLGTSDLQIADKIAKKIRHVGGGLRYVKAMGVMLEDKQLAQVSMNLTDYEKSSLYQVMETVKYEARRYGVSVVGSEVIGLLPMQALIDAAAYYLKLDDFTSEQIIEHHLLPREDGEKV